MEIIDEAMVKVFRLVVNAAPDSSIPQALT